MQTNWQEDVIYKFCLVYNNNTKINNNIFTYIKSNYLKKMCLVEIAL